MTASMMVILLFAQGASAIRFNQTSGYTTCIASPASCTRLVIGASRLTGSLPTELGYLTRLTILSLYSNQLTGTLPTQLAALTRLGDMNFGSNQLTGSLPTELGMMTSLSIIHVDTNQFIGTLPSELGALSSLTDLCVWSQREVVHQSDAETTNLSGWFMMLMRGVGLAMLPSQPLTLHGAQPFPLSPLTCVCNTYN